MNTEQRYAVDDDQAMKKNFVFIYAHIPLPLLRMEEKKCVFLALLVLEFANDDDDNDDVVSQQHCMQNSGNLHIRCVMVLIFHPVHTIQYAARSAPRLRVCTCVVNMAVSVCSICTDMDRKSFAMKLPRHIFDVTETNTTMNTVQRA